MTCILLGCVFFIVGMIGILDQSDKAAVITTIVFSVFLCVIGVFKKE